MSSLYLKPVTTNPGRLLLLMFILIMVNTVLPAQEPVIHPLFKVERSKNANIIQYDALAGTDGKLLKNDPVVAYWIRLAEQGQVKQLTWIQNTFAFGFKTKLSKDRESAIMDMVADLGTPITVTLDNNRYRATIPIDGKPVYLDRIYVQASGSGLSVKVEYIELFGKSMETGIERYQKILP